MFGLQDNFLSLLEVVGLDNINDYYDVNLKYDRLKELGISKNDSEEFLNNLLVNS